MGDHSLLPTYSAVCLPGTLVSVAGTLDKVDMEASSQWLQCGNCGVEEGLVEAEDGEIHCSVCGRGHRGKWRLSLVARVGGVWTSFTETTARTLLPTGKQSGQVVDTMEPNCVLGRRIPPFLAIVTE